jgi:hypothetical protein
VGKREGMVFGDGGVRRKNECLFFVFHHCFHVCVLCFQLSNVEF